MNKCSISETKRKKRTFLQNRLTVVARSALGSLPLPAPSVKICFTWSWLWKSLYGLTICFSFILFFFFRVFFWVFKPQYLKRITHHCYCYWSCNPGARVVGALQGLYTSLYICAKKKSLTQSNNRWLIWTILFFVSSVQTLHIVCQFAWCYVCVILKKGVCGL